MPRCSAFGESNESQRKKGAYAQTPMRSRSRMAITISSAASSGNQRSVPSALQSQAPHEIPWPTSRVSPARSNRPPAHKAQSSRIPFATIHPAQSKISKARSRKMVGQANRPSRKVTPVCNGQQPSSPSPPPVQSPPDPSMLHKKQ